MRGPRLAIIVLIAVSTLGSPHARADSVQLLTIEQAIRAADSKIGVAGVRPNNLELTFVRKYSTQWNEIAQQEDASDRAKKLHEILKGRTYWLVSYVPRPAQLGGTVSVFVDSADGEVLYVVRGR